VVSVFGQAQAHHAYLFTNRRATRIKVLVADGFGLWLASRRLHEGQFVWAEQAQGLRLELTASQIDALVLGLPWKRVSKPVVVGVA
jgi:transposase